MNEFQFHVFILRVTFWRSVQIWLCVTCYMLCLNVRLCPGLIMCYMLYVVLTLCYVQVWLCVTCNMLRVICNVLTLCYMQVWSVHYSPSGSKLVSVSEDRAIHVYDCPS